MEDVEFADAAREVIAKQRDELQALGGELAGRSTPAELEQIGNIMQDAGLLGNDDHEGDEGDSEEGDDDIISLVGDDDDNAGEHEEHLDGGDDAPADN